MKPMSWRRILSIASLLLFCPLSARARDCLDKPVIKRSAVTSLIKTFKDGGNLAVLDLVQILGLNPDQEISDLLRDRGNASLAPTEVGSTTVGTFRNLTSRDDKIWKIARFTIPKELRADYRVSGEVMTVTFKGSKLKASLIVSGTLDSIVVTPAAVSLTVSASKLSRCVAVVP